MKWVITVLILTITMCCTNYHVGGTSWIKNGLYYGKKRGLLSNATFFLKSKDSIAFLEQYREFGGVLHKNLIDTLYVKNEGLIVGARMS